MTPIHEGTPYIIIILETYAPIVAAFIVSIVLVRQGVAGKMNEFRRDTMELLRIRGDALEKQLADAHAEIAELRKEAQQRERRVRRLEDEVDELRERNGGPRRRLREQDVDPDASPSLKKPRS